MFRLLLGLFWVSLPFIAFSQGKPQQINLEGAKAIHIEASFSSVAVTSGGNEQVSVNHILSVEEEDRPDLRQLEIVRENGVINIRELKPTAKSLRKALPDRVGTYPNGRMDRKGTFNGVVVDALIEVVVPLGIAVSVATEFGSITVTNVPGLRKAKAKYGSVDVIFTKGKLLPEMDLYSNYGAVDVTLPSGQAANLDLITEYGDLMTNLDIAIDRSASEEGNFYQRVVGTIAGGGAQVRCKAPYGNVYLREAK
ncbi:MAG: hypothetical protein AAGA31_03255 [Bacteroidota bacterium]